MVATITCKVTGPRRFSADLPQGGLEIPCKLIFTGIAKDVEKVTRLLRLTESEKSTVRFQVVVNKSPSTLIKAIKSCGASIAVTDSPKTTLEINHSSNLSVDVAESPGTSVLISDSSHKNVEGSDLELLTCDDSSVAPLSVSKPTGTVSPKLHDAIVDGKCVNTQDNADASSSTTDDVQLIGSHCKRSSSKPESQRKKIRRTMPNDEELDRISGGDMLTDYSMNCACNLLKQQFTKIKGLHLTLYQRKKRNSKFVKDNLEINHSRGNHWIVATSMMHRNSDEVLVYDSMYDSLDGDTVEIIKNLFCSDNIKMVECQKQDGTTDCGLFSIANATAIANGIDPMKLNYIQGDMRMHLLQCFRQGLMTIFPFK